MAERDALLGASCTCGARRAPRPDIAAGLRHLRAGRRGGAARRHASTPTGAVTVGGDDQPVAAVRPRSGQHRRAPPGRVLGRHAHRVRGARSCRERAVRIYVVDGASCASSRRSMRRRSTTAAVPCRTNGELVHNFDPGVRSRRAHRVRVDARQRHERRRPSTTQGPQRTPADPSQAEREPVRAPRTARSASSRSC